MAGNTRTVAVGIASYRDADGNWQTDGMMGDTIEVHPDDQPRFDRLNKTPTFAALAEGRAIEDVRKPTPAERVVMDGFGGQPITAEAQNIALAAAEQAARPVRSSR